jgi:hypothetical protein
MNRDYRTEGFPESLTAKEVLILVDEGVSCWSANGKWYRADSTHPDAVKAKEERDTAHILISTLASKAYAKRQKESEK